MVTGAVAGRGGRSWIVNGGRLAGDANWEGVSIKLKIKKKYIY